MKPVNWMFATDLHGDKQDGRAVRLFRAHVDDVGPSIRGFGGDVWDFRAWRVGASEKEKRDRVRRDFDAGMTFLKWYRPTFITLGNHDARLWDQVENDGPMADFCETLVDEFRDLCRANGTRVLPYDKRRGIFRVGRMKFAHGFFDGRCAAERMGQAYGSILFGHGHAIDVASTPADHRRAARMVGCLCRLDFPYNRKHVNSLRQAHGWAYGPLYPDGTYQAFQAEVIGGAVVVADGAKVIE